MLDQISLIPISTLFVSKCGLCGRTVAQGSPVLWDRPEKKVYHYSCVGSSDAKRTIVLSDTGTYWVSFEKKNYFLESLVKQIAGVFFDPTHDVWYIENPTAVSAKQILDLAEEYNFEFDGAVLSGLANIIRLGTVTMLESMARTSSFQVKRLNKTPFPFQIKGIEFGINNQRVIIADQMGLGKTIQAMGIIAHLKLFPTVVVCPAIIK